MFINAIPFMVSTSRTIKFIAMQKLIWIAKDELFGTIRNILAMYKKRRFQSDVLLMDREFRSLGEALAQLGVELNVTSRSEYVPKVERAIRTTKERVSAFLISLPYKKYLPRMVIEVANFAIF
eukprot:4851216-Ditylum_brightwellii.AAC.1